ncbi:MAG: putative hydroxymethylpyrimidine transporter CytX [Anaerolineae bacterium]
MKIQAPPEWGIEPVPSSHRILSFLDYFALWSSLGVGLLVLLAGTLLVPGLGLGKALLAILLGSVIGSLLLAIAGVAGSDHGIPTMVMLRPVLGIRGSYLPTVLNILQLLGWGAFEVIIMGQAVDAIVHSFAGFSAYPLWAFLIATWCTLLALGGPLAVVRQWIEKFAIWLVYGISVYLSVYLFRHYDVGQLLRAPGTGEMPFWLAVDLVVAMPISWMPLVADYTRFARRTAPTFWGTFLGYAVANFWFYGLGALFVLALQTEDLIPAILSIAGGWLALLLILVDETDNGFADIYSAAVSGQNLFPRARQWWLTVAAGAICFALAVTVPIAQYENFLLFIGSVFVPLFGVLAADYFFLRKRQYDVPELYRPAGRYWYRGGFNLWAIAAWLLGVLGYQVIARVLPTIGASVPAFLFSLVIYLALSRFLRRHDRSE